MASAMVTIAGKPSVTTSIGNKGLKYVHEESTLIADEPESFAACIIRLLKDEKMCFYKVRRGCSFLRSFSMFSHNEKTSCLPFQKNKYDTSYIIIRDNLKIGLNFCVIFAF